MFFFWNLKIVFFSVLGQSRKIQQSDLPKYNPPPKVSTNGPKHNTCVFHGWLEPPLWTRMGCWGRPPPNPPKKTTTLIPNSVSSTPHPGSSQRPSRGRQRSAALGWVGSPRGGPCLSVAPAQPHSLSLRRRLREPYPAHLLGAQVLSVAGQRSASPLMCRISSLRIQFRALHAGEVQSRQPFLGTAPPHAICSVVTFERATGQCLNFLIQKVHTARNIGRTWILPVKMDKRKVFVSLHTWQLSRHFRCSDVWVPGSSPGQVPGHEGQAWGLTSGGQVCRLSISVARVQ